MLSYKESDNNQVVILQQGNKERPTHAPAPLSLLSFVTCSCRRLYLRIESTDLVTGDESGGTGAAAAFMTSIHRTHDRTAAASRF